MVLTNKFQSEFEKQEYSYLLKSLQAQYPQAHPIIKLQLERIATLKVQLDRIQRSIDNEFINSQNHSERVKKLRKYLGIPESEFLSSSDSDISEDIIVLDLFNQNIQLVVKELLSNQWENFESPRDFFNLTPIFCEFLATSAHEQGQLINNWTQLLEHHLDNTSTLSSLQLELYKLLPNKSRPQKNNGGSLESNIIEESICSANINIIKLAAKTTIDWHKKIMEKNYNKMIFNHLMQSKNASLDLNLDNLDKLYRYQTAVQRQLSNSIGELMILSKNILDN